MSLSWNGNLVDVLLVVESAKIGWLRMAALVLCRVKQRVVKVKNQDEFSLLHEVLLEKSLFL